MKNFEKYCTEPENIENYQKAKKDNFKGWECHHRLETHNSDGERRTVIITAAELKALDMYYNRPSSELIFLTESEHNRLCRYTEESRRKMSELKKGEKNPNYGKHHTFEARQKIAEANRINRTGRHWYNNGKENKFCYECPDGFVPGRFCSWSTKMTNIV